MRHLSQLIDLLIPLLSFLAFCLVESLLIYGLFRWLGAV